MRIALIGCEVVLRELCDAVVRSPHQTDLVFLPKGLHDLGAKTCCRGARPRPTRSGNVSLPSAARRVADPGTSTLRFPGAVGLTLKTGMTYPIRP